VSGKKVRSFFGLSSHSAFHWRSAQCAARMLFVVRRVQMERLDLRRCVFALGGQVTAEWSRCSGSVAWRARESAAPLRRSSAGWMPARIGRLSAGVGRRHPFTIRKASLMARSLRRV